MDVDDRSTWALPIGWGIATVVLIAISQIFDPDWAYYAAWVSAGMVSISLAKALKARERARRLDLEDQVLALQVGLTRTQRELEELRARIDSGEQLLGVPSESTDEQPRRNHDRS